VVFSSGFNIVELILADGFENAVAGIVSDDVVDLHPMVTGLIVVVAGRGQFRVVMDSDVHVFIAELKDQLVNIFAVVFQQLLD